jgi:cell division protein FtsW
VRIPRRTPALSEARGESTITRGLRRARQELPIEGQILLLVTLGLTIFGQVMVYSASAGVALTSPAYNHDALFFVKNGLIYTVAGLVAMLVMASVPVRWLKVAAAPLLLLSLFLLVAVLALGPVVNGARRWIAVGPLTVQPSELAKLGLLLTVCAFIAARPAPETLRELLMPTGILTAIVCGLVLIEPDLGSALATMLMIAGIVVVAGSPKRLILGSFSVGAFLVGASIWLEPYRRERFLVFLHPWDSKNAGDAGYQIVQGMIAIGSGGLTGKGLGQGVQKINFLPEAHTDMIFAVIGEELGLVGCASVAAAFAVFAWAGYRIARHASDRYAQLLAVGVTTLIAGQAAINMGAVLGIMPLTGIPLPLISYGSSSKLVTLLLAGILLSVCRDRPATVAAGEVPSGQPVRTTRRRRAPSAPEPEHARAAGRG